MGPGRWLDRKAAQVSLGSPFTFIPQLPQTPIRQDQRKESEPSSRSLMWLRASRTTQSFRKGTSYSWKTGSPSCSGR